NTPTQPTFYIDDLGINNWKSRKFKVLFDVPENKDKDLILIISLSKDQTVEELTKLYNLDAFGATLLSTAMLAPIAKSKLSAPRMNVFKFDGMKFGRTSYSDYEADKNQKILCSLTKEQALYGSQIARFTDLKGKRIDSYSLD